MPEPSKPNAQRAPMPDGAEVAGLEGLAYITFEKVDAVRQRLEGTLEDVDAGAWASAEDAWLLTWGASSIIDRCEETIEQARKLQAFADTLYLNAVEAGQAPEYPDAIDITTAVLERIAAERRELFSGRGTSADA